MSERYFKYGCEGGGETLYRDAGNGKILFYTEGSSGGIEPDEPVKTWKRNYTDFEDFWKNRFTENEQWFRFYPIFIHEEIKGFIKQELEKIEGDGVYKDHTKSALERA